MPSALSIDLRERVVAAMAEGASCHRAAARFGVSASSVSRWAGRLRREGRVADTQALQRKVSDAAGDTLEDASKLVSKFVADARKDPEEAGC